MRVDLQPGVRDGQWALLRPLTGHDELTIDPEMPAAGTALLRRVLRPAPGTSVCGDTAASLTPGDRDRLLAAVYRQCYGDRVDTVAACAACGEGYEFGFALDDLIGHQQREGRADVAGPDAGGFYLLPSGARFRLPTIGDLEAVCGLSPEHAAATLRERCLADPAHPDAEAAERAMEQLSPVLDLEIATRCPSCASAQQVHFSIEAFLIGALAAERRYLTREVHRLAAAYGWGLDDILSLGRDDRRTLVRHVDAERGRGAAA